MKKILMVTFATLLLFSLTACSTLPANETPTAPPQDKASASSSGDAAPSAPENDAVSEPVFGKVKSLVGNEVTLDLAKIPANENASEDGKEEVAAAAITNSASVSVTGEDSGDGDGKTNIGSYDANGNVISSNDIPKIELEYTGETKDLTIPAGLQIFDVMGKEVKMADLKEGNVLMITQDEKGVILSMTVME